MLGANRLSRSITELLDFIVSKRTIDSNNCWNWNGDFRGGYGVLWYNNKRHAVHRFIAYVSLGFNLRGGLWVLHKCDNQNCFNPEHLFIGTASDNMQDMSRKGRGRKGGRTNKKTHCVHGHEFTPANSYISPRGIRLCVTCQRLHTKRRYKK